MQILRPIYLSLGSNQGNKLEKLQKAIDLIGENIGIVRKISSVYKTASWGFKSDDFYNICLEISSSLNPENLLNSLELIERKLGRIISKTTDYAARPIDIDILFFDNEIIFSKYLIVPHKEMLQRKFVMIPLVEIAPNFIHPIEHQRIITCAKNCTDTTAIEKTEHILKKPVCISEKYNYIAIEGNIGAGKTSLTKLISDQFNAKTVLERFADNPFLPKFYNDNERFAFPLEMSFLADRYQQLSEDLAQFDLFKNFIISDYYIFKSLIFAQVTLQNDEYFLYRKMFDIMYKEITKPDLYIYLYQNTARLIEKIKKRGRDYEQNIAPEYLDKIHKGYVNFIESQQGLNTLIIDVSDKDFIKKPEDYRYIIDIIKKA